MNESSISALIPVQTATIGETALQTVNVRKLYDFLDSKQKFSDWIKNRIEQYGFSQDIDFTVIPSFTKDDTAFGGQRKTLEYHVTVGMAKELAMVERNDKGKEARKYFIECERQLKDARAQPRVHELPHEHAFRIAPQAKLAAEAFGFTGNQAVLSANKAIVAFTGVNLLEAMGATALPAQDNEPLLTPTDIAKRLDIPPRDANELLTDAGMQTSHRDHKNRLYYELTESGAPFGAYLDTGKKHSNGTPIRQVKWRSGVLDELRGYMELRGFF